MLPLRPLLVVTENSVANPPKTSWSVETFDRNKHDRSSFDCGVPALNDWITTKVSQFEKKDLARTYVLVESGLSVVKGYYALSMVCLSTLEILTLIRASFRVAVGMGRFSSKEDLCVAI